MYIPFRQCGGAVTRPSGACSNSERLDDMLMVATGVNQVISFDPGSSFLSALTVHEIESSLETDGITDEEAGPEARGVDFWSRERS